MKYIYFLLCGIILVVALNTLDIVISSAFSDTKRVQFATLQKTDSGDTLLSRANDCSGVPAAYRQYCNNISITRYGFLFTVTKDVKEVPPNPYVASLGHTAYLVCSKNGCNTPSAASIQNAGKQDMVYVLIATVGTVLVFSYLSLVIYPAIRTYRRG